MGALAEGFAAFAQPLLDQTDGSLEQMNKALTMSQLCYNLALLPEERRDTALREMRSALSMDDQEFEEFRRSVVIPMIRRHQEMFPRLHARVSQSPWLTEPSPQAHARTTPPGETYPGTDRYAPCPCNSGKKYKFCCGAKRR